MIDIKKGDCLELMKEIKDNSIDMILSDLPYSNKKRKTTWNDWDKPLDLEKMWREYNRIIKENRSNSIICTRYIQC